MACRLTQGNRHDGKGAASVLDGLKGLAFDDKGDIGKKLAETFLRKDLNSLPANVKI